MGEVVQENDELNFAALQRATGYLPIERLDDGCVYLIHARNSHIGQWKAAKNGFVLLREKSGERYLALEFHWDAPVAGTAKPFFKISEPISEAALRECLETKLHELPYSVFVMRTEAWLKRLMT